MNMTDIWSSNEFIAVLWLPPQWNFWKVRESTTSNRNTILIQFISVNLQLQSQRSSLDRQFKGPVDCIRQVVRAQGIRGLWTGSTGSFIVRGNMFWMFMSFEVSDSSTTGDLELDFRTCRLLWEAFRHWKALSTKYVCINSLNTSIYIVWADQHRSLQFPFRWISLVRFLGICDTSR